MLYRLRIRVLRSHSPLVQWAIKILRVIATGQLTRIESGDIREKLLRGLVQGRSFADIGCMWGVNGQWCFWAEEQGASKVTGLDIYPASEQFENERERRSSKVRFVQGDINSRHTIKEVGAHDIVFCSGLLYHQPNPVATLSNLRLLCNEFLLLHTMTIPEMSGIRNMAIYYPFLDERQRRIWQLGIGRQRGITTPYRAEQGYGNWFWGLTPSCLESMLKTVGFEAIEHYAQNFYSCVLCRTTDAMFRSVSGDWTSPLDTDFVD